MIHKPRQTKDLFSCFNNKDIEALEEEIITLFLNREYDMLIENFDSFIKENYSNKKTSKILIYFLKSNIIKNKNENNIEFWNKYKDKILIDYKYKGTVLSCIGFSFLESNKLETAKIFILKLNTLNLLI